MYTMIIKDSCKNYSGFSAGISLLESSLCTVLFCSLLMLGAGLWNYIDVNNGLTRIADRYVYETTLGAYQYNKILGRYEIDMSKIRSEFRDKLSGQALSELENEVSASSDSQLRLEFAFTTVAIDTTNGIPKYARAVNSSDIISIGKSNIPDFLTDGNSENGEVDFDTAIKSYVDKASNTLAIPTQSFGVNGSQALYLPEVPIIAVRAVYNYQDNSLLKMLGIIDEPYGWDIKVAALRGDVG